MKRVLAGFVLGALSLDGAAAADIPLKAPRVQQIVDWTGLYFGAHAGFGRGFSNATLADPALVATGNFFGGPVGGLQAGYNFQLPSRLVLSAPVRAVKLYKLEKLPPSVLPMNTDPLAAPPP